MDTYTRVEELRQKRQNGDLPEWDKLSNEKLEELCEEGLSNSMLMYIFDVTKDRVYYRRQKLGIRSRDLVYENAAIVATKTSP